MIDTPFRVVHYVLNPDHYIGIVIANTTLLYKYMYSQLCSIKCNIGIYSRLCSIKCNIGMYSQLCSIKCNIGMYSQLCSCEYIPLLHFILHSCEYIPLLHFILHSCEYIPLLHFIVTVNKEVDNAVFSIRLISLGRLVISGLSFMSTKHHFDVNIKSINIINSTFTHSCEYIPLLHFILHSCEYIPILHFILHSCEYIPILHFILHNREYIHSYVV
jgi:hypothetical protein